MQNFGAVASKTEVLGLGEAKVDPLTSHVTLKEYRQNTLQEH